MLNQQETLRAAESELNLGPVALANELGTPYKTYADWKSGRRTMPGIAYRCLEIIRAARLADVDWREILELSETDSKEEL